MAPTTDPYAYAQGLVNTANDLVSDLTSFTVQDIADILRDAAALIVNQADEYHSYASRTRVTLNVGHEVIDLTDEIFSLVTTEFIQNFVNQAIRSYAKAGNSEVWV